MKKQTKIQILESDLGGVPGDPTTSPIARAMSRLTSKPFRHVGRILYTMSDDKVAEVYSLGPEGQNAWRDWCRGVPSHGEFTATLEPQTEGLIAVTQLGDPPRRNNPPSLLNPQRAKQLV